MPTEERQLAAIMFTDMVGYSAMAQRDDHLKELSATTYIAPYNVAAVYAGLGDKDQAFAWLDRAYNERSSMLPLYLTNDTRTGASVISYRRA